MGADFMNSIMINSNTYFHDFLNTLKNGPMLETSREILYRMAQFLFSLLYIFSRLYIYIFFKGVYFVISSLENSSLSKLISSHQQKLDVVKVGAMEHSDRSVFVRNALKKYGKSLDESPFNNQVCGAKYHF